MKTLCGFSRAEIARALLVNEETVKKRISRAKQKLIENHIELVVPTADELPDRLETVHAVLYLMFNEGYSATSAEQTIRSDVCEEAARLCHLLCEHPHCNTSATFALLSLMLFHAARFHARLDHQGLLVLLQEQDRSKWDWRLLGVALEYLRRSASGTLSAYHLEAGIAMYHSKAKSFADTDWPTIIKHYDLLIQRHRSPIYLLNRAIAVSYADSPKAGIHAMEEILDHPQLQHYHLLDATMGELHRRDGNTETARNYFRSALRKTKSKSDRQLLERRMRMLD